MAEGKTKSGFKFKIEDFRLDNMELVDAFAECDNGNLAAINKASTLLLGEEQKAELYDHIRTDNGNVPTEDFSRELAEIMEIIEAGKKS